jgi:hypothetical protein
MLRNIEVGQNKILVDEAIQGSLSNQFQTSQAVLM